MARRGLWLGCLLFAGAYVACTTNHEALEKKPTPPAGGGAGGTSASAGGPSLLAGFGGSVASGGGHGDDEPPGDSVLTFVNGVVDAPSLALCLAKVDAEGNVTPLGSPLTDTPLGYGQSLVLREVEGIDFATEGLEPIVIAGDLDLIADLDCEAAIERARSEEALSDGEDDLGAGGAAGAGSGNAGASTGGNGSGESGGIAGSAGSAGDGGSAGTDAGPPAVRSPLRVRGLPVISAGSLNAGRSLVFVANGCLGGAAYTGKRAESYCGSGYTPRQPTASAVLVSLSRKSSPDHVALQVVHASLANAQVELRARPGFPATAAGVSIATVVQGQVGPRPASIANALFDLGSARKYVVSVEAEGSSLFMQSWTDVLAQGGLSELKDGLGFALILSGPRGDLPAVPGLWNAPTVTAIAVDPE